MDLNEKLAARRKDLGIEAEKAKKAERDAIEVEAVNRITESGSMQHATTSTAKINDEDVLTKAAINRFTTWNHVSFWGALALSLGCFSEGAWLVGLIGIIFAFVVRANAISKYKKEIINEGNRRERREAAQTVTQIVGESIQHPIAEQATVVVNGNIQPALCKKNSQFENAYEQPIDSSSHDLIEVDASQRKLTIGTDNAGVADTTQISHIKIDQPISCMGASNHADIIRKNRNQYCLMIVFVPIVAWVIFPLISKTGWSQITITPAYWAVFVGIFSLTWWLFGRWIAQCESWAATELNFSKDSLHISYRLLKASPELIIPWSAIGNVAHVALNNFGDMAVIFIQDKAVATQLRRKLKCHFGSDRWLGTPWVGGKSDTCGLRILTDAATANKLEISIPTWRDSIDNRGQATVS